MGVVTIPARVFAFKNGHVWFCQRAVGGVFYYNSEEICHSWFWNGTEFFILYVSEACLIIWMTLASRYGRKWDCICLFQDPICKTQVASSLNSRLSGFLSLPVLYMMKAETSESKWMWNYQENGLFLYVPIIYFFNIWRRGFPGKLSGFNAILRDLNIWF